MRQSRIILAGFRCGCLLVLTIVAGCAQYQSKPLTEQAVSASLATPPLGALRIDAAAIKHSTLEPIELNLDDGLSPDEAAVIAVVINPLLRAQRDRHGLASAQLLQAGILPNPQLSYALDIPSGGTTAKTNTGFTLGLDWDVTSLISRQAHVEAAQAQLQAVDLGIAWQEWQVAQAARLAGYRVLVLEKQHELASEVAQRLDDNRHLIDLAVSKGQATGLQQSAGETAYHQAYQRQLDLGRQLDEQRLRLKQAIGLPAKSKLKVQAVPLPDHFDPPPSETIQEQLTSHRLDLLALQRGYASQESAVRAAVLEQFPKINIGFTHARDTSNLFTLGPSVSIGIPLFDRNQGRIAIERATRRQLYDEYIQRVFEARSNVARLETAIDATNRQIEAAKDALPPLKKLVATYKQAVEQGQADALSYYIARNSLADQRIKLLSLKMRLIDLRIALELAGGNYRVTKNDLGDVQP